MTHLSVNSRPRSGKDDALPPQPPCSIYLASSKASKGSPADSAHSNVGAGREKESSFHEGRHKKFSKWLVALVCLLPNQDNLSLRLRFWGDKDGSPAGRSKWDPANPSGGVRGTGHSQAPAGAAAPQSPLPPSWGKPAAAF